MRAVAATNPVHPLTSNEKIALGIGGLLVAIGIGGLALMSSAGAAAPNAGASSAAWTLATKIDPGQTFRASADVVDTLETFFPGATVYVAPTSAIPVDWPAADLAPGEVADGVTTGKGVRFRLDATNAGSTAISLPTPAAFAASMSAAQAAGKLTLAQVQALIAAYSDLRVYVQQPSAHPALVKATWIPLAPGGQIAPGQEFRASIDLRADLTALGLQLWDQFDTPPADWPTTDNGPNRWRIQGVWSGAALTMSDFDQLLDLGGNAGTLIWVESA